MSGKRSDEYYQSCLSTILKGTDRPKTIRQLISLQAAARSDKPVSKIAPPSWIISTCNSHLSSFLIEEGGVLALLTALDENSSLNEDWKWCESLATLVSACPRSMADDRSNGYYENICQQLPNDQEIPRRYARFYSIAVRRLFSKRPTVVKNRILDPIFDRFMRCFNPKLDLPSEEDLTSAVDHLKLLYVSTNVDESFYDSLPLDVALILLGIYFDIRQSPSYCRTPLKEVIHAYMENAQSDSVTSLVKTWICLKRYTSTTFSRPVNFVSGSTGGLKVVQKAACELIDVEERIDVLQELFGSLSEDAQARIFSQGLRLLHDEDGATTSTAVGPVQIQDPDDVLAMLTFFVGILGSDPDLATGDTRRMAKLIKILLEKFADENGENMELQSRNVQNLHLILATMGALFANCDITKNEEDFTDLRSTLHELSEKHSNINIRSAAQDLHFAMRSSSSPDPAPASPNQSNQASYHQAMLDLRDPLIPTRAHALVVLTNLIKSKDPITCSNLDSLIPMLLDQLIDDDSYVYLAAVNCLAAAGLFRPNTVLPILLTVFRNSSDQVELDRRLKAGEAIMKISRELGDVAPFYGNDMINVFLSLLREGDEETMASSLSNIAEICRLMSFKLNCYIVELFDCAKQLLQWDNRSLIRRSAINLLALLTENGDEFLEVLGDLSREFYHFVKDTYENDQDDIVRLHAQKCLENIGEHAKKFLKPLIQMIN